MKTACTTNKRQRLEIGKTEVAEVKAGFATATDANVRGSTPPIRIGDDGTVVIGSGGPFIDLSINAR